MCFCLHDLGSICQAFPAEKDHSECFKNAPILIETRSKIHPKSNFQGHFPKYIPNLLNIRLKINKINEQCEKEGLETKREHFVANFWRFRPALHFKMGAPGEPKATQNDKQTVSKINVFWGRAQGSILEGFRLQNGTNNQSKTGPNGCTRWTNRFLADMQQTLRLSAKIKVLASNNRAKINNI